MAEKAASKAQVPESLGDVAAWAKVFQDHSLTIHLCNDGLRYGVVKR